MPLFTWSSLAGGFLTGKFTRDNLDSFDDYFDKVVIHAYAYEENFQRLDRLRKLAQEKNVSLPRLSLAYCLSYPLTIFQLVGCRTGEEFADNKKALDIELTTEEIAFLEN
jgi:aryl-alcohol dehydrogenase-like predicted oxidoreductase